MELAKINTEEFGTLVFETAKYCSGQLAITAYSTTEGPWATITVNLEDYGMVPTAGCIFVDQDLYNMPEYYSIIKEALSFKGAKEIPIEYGFANSVMLELQPDIVAKINTI